MNIKSIFAVLIALQSTGCGYTKPDSVPFRPEQVNGWKEIQRNGLTSRGEFLLYKDKGVEDGKLGVR